MGAEAEGEVGGGVRRWEWKARKRLIGKGESCQAIIYLLDLE